MSDLPNTLRYTKDHEWARTESDGTVTVGITRHAVDQLGDITAVSLPSVGDRLAAHDRFGDIDSVKAVSDLYSPIEGEVVAINRELDGNPEHVNDDPYGVGWMIRVRPASSDALAGLLDAKAYAELIA
jgi:glycine cleavage system H protein